MKLLAIDVGTTAVKVAVVGDDGVATVVEERVDVSTPHPGWVEQDTEQWWSATVQAIRRLSVDGVAAITVTGQMQDLVPIDGDRVLRPAILYSDQRATAEHGELIDSFGDEWARRAMAAPDATNVAAKWNWLRNHEPDVATRTSRVLLGGAGLVTWRLTGRATSDLTTAATTGLLDVGARTWWSTLVDSIELPVPELTSGHVGPIDARVAASLGLTADIPVHHASGDAVSTSIGVVGDHVDTPYAYLGTSGWVGTLRNRAEPRPGLIVLPAGERWLSVAPILAAGSAVEWARTVLAVDVTGFDRLAGEVCAAMEGVVFVPHLDGVRLPSPDPHASGAFVGLRRSTSRAVLAAAVYEGVARSLAELADVVLGGHRGEMRVCGGGSRSDVWCQTIADVIGQTVVRVADEHASLRGAASEALGVITGRKLPPAPTLARFEPRPDRVEAHRHLTESARPTKI